MFSKKQVQRTSDLSFSQSINFKVDLLLKEQRHQRSDLAQIIRTLNTMTTDKDLQKQVDKYFEDEPVQEEQQVQE